MSNRQDRKKAEREKLRKERERQEAEHARKARVRLALGYGSAGVLVVAVLVGLVVVIANAAGGGGEAHVSLDSGSTNEVPLDERDGTPPPPWENTNLEASAEAAGCDLRLDLPEEGQIHIPPDTPEEERPEYETNPPTSGDHVDSPYQQADGAYAEKPDDIFVVHSLEHGRIALQYDPSLPEEQQLELRGLYDTMHAGALFYPNPDMPHAVAATAWQNKIICDEYRGAETMDAIRNFGVATFGRSPEPANAFGPLDGPTPGRPDAELE